MNDAHLELVQACNAIIKKYDLTEWESVQLIRHIANNRIKNEIEKALREERKRGHSS